MRFHKKLIGEKCYLSPVTEEDAEKWADWFNDLEVTIPLGDEAYTPTSASKERKIAIEILQSGAHVFSIVDLKSDELIGRCMLFQIDNINQHAKLGIVIGEKSYWSKGYGQEAVGLLLDYGFNLLNLHNIMLGVFDYNKAAIKCYKKVGFQEIGYRREVRIIGGKKYNMIFMDILADEFKSVFVNKLLE